MNAAIFLLVLVLPFIGPCTLLSSTSAVPSTSSSSSDGTVTVHLDAATTYPVIDDDSGTDTATERQQDYLPLEAIASAANRRQRQPLIPLILCSAWSRVQNWQWNLELDHSATCRDDQQHAMFYCPCSKPRKPKHTSDPAATRGRRTPASVPAPALILASEPADPEDSSRSLFSSAKFRTQDDSSFSFLDSVDSLDHEMPSSSSLRSAKSRASSASSSNVIKTIPPVAFDHVRILTYNFFLRPPFISDYNGDSKEERLTSFISTVLPRYDIIALQETFSGYSSRVQRLEKAATRAGFLSHTRGPKGSMASGHLLDAGLLVLSRWPIKHSARLTFSRGVTVDRLASKGATYSLHEHPERPNVRLHLFNTHLQASYSTAPRIDDPSVECRRQQMRELVAFIQEQVGAHWPAVANDSAAVNMSPQPQEQGQRGRRGPAVVPLVASPADIPLPASPQLDDVSAIKPDLPIQRADSPTLAGASTASTTSTATVTPASAASNATYDLILVCGDLNVNSFQSPPEEYNAMLNLFSADGQFNVTDVLAAEGKQEYTQLPWVWFSKHRREHPVPPRDAFAKEGGRLDYILLLEPRSEMSHAVETKVDKCQSKLYNILHKIQNRQFSEKERRWTCGQMESKGK
ncbi:hypothetical protein BCR44DRAFT_29844 [Catenaria anguillulae PL171]|uniref:sphingomyelin phosphodiesterase n=1 Tax=Catenaria anguillulae PL171 TaxID=765915 RepID=A0A1Y2HYG2_9FUNG|nr:hypothetical protein BCR44DRAFT_29844 [Catenaria anguillulae PL171]